MTLFVSTTTRAEISGAFILAFVRAAGSKVYPVLVRHGLDHLQEDNWYVQQQFLDVLRDLYEGRGAGAVFDLAAVGRRIAESVVFPGDVDTIEAALLWFSAWYKHMHRGGDDTGWKLTIGLGQAECTSNTPYPSDIEYGMLYEIARRALPARRSFSVRHEAAPRRSVGANTCVYRLTWETR